MLARVATRKAKPDGVYFLRKDMVQEMLRPLPVDDLPGVGWSISKKLAEMGVKTCEQLQVRGTGQGGKMGKKGGWDPGGSAIWGQRLLVACSPPPSRVVVPSLNLAAPLSFVAYTAQQGLTMEQLKREFGGKTGEKLYNFSRGIDMRPLKTSQVRISQHVLFCCLVWQFT